MWSDPAIVNDLLKKGLFARIYEPQVRGPEAVHPQLGCVQTLKQPLFCPLANPLLCLPSLTKMMIRGFLAADNARTAAAAAGSTALPASQQDDPASMDDDLQQATAQQAQVAAQHAMATGAGQGAAAATAVQ